MRRPVRNAGALSGSEVAQLYLSYPIAAAEPRLVLRGFHKTAVLGAQQRELVSFSLSCRDLSVWQPSEGARRGGWRLASGVVPNTSRFVVSVGASSRDLRLSHTFELRPAEGQGSP